MILPKTATVLNYSPTVKSSAIGFTEVSISPKYKLCRTNAASYQVPVPSFIEMLTVFALL